MSKDHVLAKDQRVTAAEDKQGKRRKNNRTTNTTIRQTVKQTVCLHQQTQTESLRLRLHFKPRSEVEARAERKCGGKPLTAVAQGLGFLSASRKNITDF